MAKINWFEIWHQDKQNMINTMVDDLNNGYDYYGKSIREQREMIDAYKAQFDEEMKRFRAMDDGKIQHWCYYDLKRRGAID